MKIGELFVNLGFKGGDSAVKALGGVKGGLNEVKSMSLEAKAAILAVVYGLEHMMSGSAKLGSGLSNFAALTGISTKQLQQWQYAARQVGVSAEEVAGSMKSTQGIIANMLMGKGAPAGMADVAARVGLDEKRLLDKNKNVDISYLYGQLQKYAQVAPKLVGNEMLKSFGLSEGMIAGMRKNAFIPSQLNKAPTYSNKEVGQLEKADVAWANLGNKVEMAFGHFTAKHGEQMVKDISKITDQVVRLVEALVVLGEKYKIFDKISQAAGVIADAVEAKPGTMMGEKHLETKIWSWMKEKFNDATGGKGSPSMIAPPGIQLPLQHQKQDIKFDQTLIFQHDGKDANKTGDSVHKSVKGAFRQLQAQTQFA